LLAQRSRLGRGARWGRSVPPELSTVRKRFPSVHRSVAGCVSFLRVSFAAWLGALTLASIPLASAAETGNGDAVSTSGTPGATERARLVYERAAQAYAEKRYRDAIDLFQQADALRPNPAFSFNVGIAYEDMGDSAMALRHYRAYLRKLP